MESIEPLALGATAYLTLIWLHLHPTKQQRQHAARTQDLRAWDWRS